MSVSCLHIGSKFVRAHTFLRRIRLIPCGIDVYLLHYLACHNGMQDHLKESDLRGSIELVVQGLRFILEGLPLMENILRLIVISGRVKEWAHIQQLVFSTDDESSVRGHDLGRSCCHTHPKFARGPFLEPPVGAVRFHEIAHIVSHVEEVRDRNLERLQVAHIDNPDLCRVLLVCEMHLLPRLGELDCVDPFVVSRVTHVVEMVVHPRVPYSVRLAGDGKPLDIPAVVIAPEDGNFFRDLHSRLVVATNFFIHAPHLRHCAQIRHAECALQDALLEIHHVHQGFRIHARTPSVSIATHTHSPHRLPVFCPCRAILHVLF